MLEDIALSSFRHGWFRMDELKSTYRELLMAAYRDTGEAKIPGWASCLTTGSWGSVFLFVDRFPWSGRQRRTRTGCAITGAGPGGPNPGMSRWIVHRR